MPDAAITTDIIVGFPGETDEDFEDTLRVVEQARFTSAFTFQYSIREGTPAATMPDQVPKAVVQERYNRLLALQERISLEENQAQVGREVEVLVSMGEGKKDAATHRLTGRAEDNRLVHFELPAGSEAPRPGDIVSVRITHAAPFHLLADAPDGAPLRIRRTRAGDAWDRSQAESCAVPAAPAGDGRRAARRVARAAHAPRRRVSGAHASASERAVGERIDGGTAALRRRRCHRHRQERALARSRRSPARHGRPAEIVNADAMQLYRGMDIGTAKLALDERRGIPHHLLDVLEVTEDAAVARYQSEARAAIDAILERGSHAILVGGSGLYVSSVLFDFRFPPRDEAVRARLEAELEAVGPGRAVRTAARGGSRDRGSGRSPQRATHRPRPGGARPGRGDARRGPSRRAGALAALDDHRPPKPARRARRPARRPRRADVGRRACSTRCERLRADGLENGVTARRAIGYAQALAQLRGDSTRAEAIAETQALTRRYARRQVSWFKRYPDARWVDPGDSRAVARILGR